MKRPAPIPEFASAVRDKRAFVALLRAKFAIGWHGFHGAAHWARVAPNGRILCRASSANPRVVGLFARLHDLRRKDEGSDPQHGPALPPSSARSPASTCCSTARSSRSSATPASPTAMAR